MKGVEKKFGLLGKNISYSFSKKYFTEKFEKLQLKGYEYANYDIQQIQDFKLSISKDITILGGMNVTIPYKEVIIPYLDEVDEMAAKIGAVNTIKIVANNRLKGYNTDAYGFEKSLRSGMRGDEKKALILGTGGASKAVAFVLENLGIYYTFVSRSQGEGYLVYEELDQSIMRENELIINCSPIGTFPNIDAKPNIPYEYLSNKHLLFDLIYNPEKTLFLQMGERAGATIINGKPMLEFQADRSWEIWNS